MCYQSTRYRLGAWSLLRDCLGTGLFGKGGSDRFCITCSACKIFASFFLPFLFSCKAVFISTHAFCNFSFSYSFPHPSVGGERMVVRMLSCWTIYYSCLLRRQKILTFTRNFLCLMSSEIHQYSEQQTTSFNSYILNRYN